MSNTPPREHLRGSATFELLFATLGLAAVGVCYRTELLALDPGKWATVSAWGLVLVGIWIASSLDHRLEQMLRRLHQREAIALSNDEFERWLRRVFWRASRAGMIGSVVLPTALIAAYMGVYGGDRLNQILGIDRVWLVAEITLEVIAARIVGRYVGRGISYGFLGKRLGPDQVTLRVIPGHSDRTAGLRPIGDFYFYQATVTALPVIFFAFWVLMMPAWVRIAPNVISDFATQWKNAYLAFLFVAVGIEVLAFLWPLWFVHREMARQKNEMQSHVDSLSATLAKLQREMTSNTPSTGDGETRTQLVEQIALLENLPTWALAPEVRQRFAWSNIAFLSPFVLQISQVVMDTVMQRTT